MKKTISIMLSLLILSVSVASAAGIDEPESFTLIGRVIEQNEDGSFLLESLEDDNQTLVLVDENTVEVAEWKIGVGDVVTVEYNGKMTRSLPPQITAQAIRSHSLEGMVQEVDTDSNRVLIDSATVGSVWVTLPDGETAADYTDAYVRIFFGGVMALSLPAQANAFTIEKAFVEEGVVVEADANYLLVDLDDTRTNQVRVAFDDHTKSISPVQAGDTIQVFYNGIMTRSLPPQIYATVIIPVNPQQ